MKFVLKTGSFFCKVIVGYKMKTKEIIKNLHFLKSNNRKNISRNFSGAAEDSVGSVQFQIVPCFSLYFFSVSIDPFQYSQC